MTGRRRVAGMLVLALVVVAGFGSWLVRAAKADAIAYVDMVAVDNLYVRPLVEPLLQQEVARLQQEFDTKSKDMNEKEKTELFNSLQAQLDAHQQELRNKHWVTVLNVIKEVAGQAGFEIVLERGAIIVGGVDLTDQVLTQLNVKR
jgi:outer membrane protein